MPALLHMPSSVFFFFQAEDGIRDIGVTGVQTCALPILKRHKNVVAIFGRESRAFIKRQPQRGAMCLHLYFGGNHVFAAVRSEERRVGKECRSRWSPYH